MYDMICLQDMEVLRPLKLKAEYLCNKLKNIGSVCVVESYNPKTLTMFQFTDFSNFSIYKKNSMVVSLIYIVDSLLIFL